MKMILLFDLPTETDIDRSNYRHFREMLIKKGFTMLQFSVYARSFANKDSADFFLNTVKKQVPQEGKVRVLIMTEKQYLNMVVLEPFINIKEKLLINDGNFLKI